MAAVMMAYPARDNFQGYPQQYAMYQARSHEPQSAVAHSLDANPYANYAQVPGAQPYQTTQNRSSTTPHLPAAEEGMRPSLPSISNLLGIADGDRPGQDTAAIHQQQIQAQAQQSIQHAQSNPHHDSIPPTPPFRNDSVMEGTHSPSTISTGSSLSNAQPFYLGSALNNVEATEQRSITAHQFIKRHSVPSQPNVSPYGNYSASQFAPSPGAASAGSYYSPNDQASMTSGLYHQRPLPSNFPPQPSLSTQVAHQGSPPRVWEHHHYINPSSQAQFPQSQDRYICPTCNKAFSRPSSLKIHSHSHTGEKPFKCPHAGCGKAFSVRSNMKRHERGCHTPGGGLGGIPSSHLG